MQNREQDFFGQADERKVLLLVAAGYALASSRQGQGISLMFIVDGDPNNIGNGDVSIRTDKGTLVALVYAKTNLTRNIEVANVIASALNATFCPSHADLMVTPETLDEFLENHPPPDEPLIAAAHDLLDALKAIIAHGELANVSAAPERFFTGGKKPATKDVWQFPRHMLTDIKAAISKATA